MGTSEPARRDRRGRGRPDERRLWLCENCSAATAEPRKRCAECGTSRF